MLKDLGLFVTIQCMLAGRQRTLNSYHLAVRPLFRVSPLRSEATFRNQVRMRHDVVTSHPDSKFSADYFANT